MVSFRASLDNMDLDYSKSCNIIKINLFVVYKCGEELKFWLIIFDTPDQRIYQIWQGNEREGSATI